MKNDIPEGLPEYLREEYLKWKASPKRYESLYPISYRILKKHINSEKPHEKDQKRPR